MVPSNETTATRVTLVRVCFAAWLATGETGGAVGTIRQVNLWGVRLHSGNLSDARGAIVLVSGGGNNHTIWDIHENLSIARDLARAGIAVFLYDRLGILNSRSQVRNGAEAVDHVSHLHDIVTAVRGGTYRTTDDLSCDGAKPSGEKPVPRVVVAGMSLGGWIVADYAGRFAAGDGVAGIVQGEASHVGIRPAALPIVARALATTREDGYASFPAGQQDCEDLYFFLPGVPDFLRPICRYSPLYNTPVGDAEEFAVLPPTHPIQVRRVPHDMKVLLTFAENSIATNSSDIRSNEASYWRNMCGCSVTNWTQPRAGHDFMFHWTAPQWTQRVVQWLDDSKLMQTKT